MHTINCDRNKIRGGESILHILVTWVSGKVPCTNYIFSMKRTII